jgi:hypothetical protein
VPSVLGHIYYEKIGKEIPEHAYEGAGKDEV